MFKFIKLFIALMLVSLSVKALADHTDVALSSSVIQQDNTSQIPAFELLTEQERHFLAQLGPLSVPATPHESPLSYVGREGEYKGYLNGVLRYVAEQLGLTLEHYPTTYAQSLKDFMAGRADILANFSSFEHPELQLERSMPIMHTKYVALGRSGEPPIKSMADFNGHTLVLVKEFAQTITIREKYPHLRALLVDDIGQAIDLVRRGEADFYIDNAIHAGYFLRNGMISDLSISGWLPESEMGYLEFYIGVRADQPLLLSAINKVLGSMSHSKWQDLRALWLRDMDPVSRLDLALTSTERAWLRANPTIKVTYEKHWAPFAYQDKNGEYLGLSVSYMDRISELLGVKFEPVEGSRFSDLLQPNADSEIDIIPALVKLESRLQYLDFTHSYLNVPVHLFSKVGMPLSYINQVSEIPVMARVAVLDNYAIVEQLREQVPTLQLIHVDSVTDGLQAVLNGHADYYAGNGVSTAYYISKGAIDSIQDVGKLDLENEYGIGVRKGMPILTSILNKALIAIPEHEKQQIYNSWRSVRFEQQTDYTLLAQLGMATLVLALLFLYWIKRLASEVTLRRSIEESLEDTVQERTRKLQSTEARFRSFFESNNCVMLLVDPDTQEIIDANKAACDFYGYTTQHMRRKTLAGLQVEQSMAKLSNKPLPLLESNYTIQQVHHCANKEIRTVELHFTPISYESHLQAFILVQDITERKEAEKQMLFNAHYDLLTHLPNRIHILNQLQSMLEEIESKGELVGVALLDIDDFKRINDSGGHEYGDQLLLDVTARLKRVLGTGEILGRLGGDEFAVLVHGKACESEFENLALRIMDVMKPSFMVRNRDMKVSISMGLAVAPTAGKSATELLRSADTAMYHAKDLGRDTYTFFTENMNTELERRIEVEQQMEGALQRGEFSLAFQPKIEIISGRISSAEALLRWNSPKLGFVSPMEFIPIAEQTGLIMSIGEFVMEQSVKTLANWQRQHGNQLSMALNLSPRQFRDAALVKKLKRYCVQYGVSSGHIELEITEGVLLSGETQVHQLLFEMHQLGFSIAMDDFGTGYASLSYLRQYPFDVLKIDRAFISDIVSNERDLGLVKAAINMAHGMGLSVVAEGVETADQLDLLALLKCNIAQGYYFSKPVPAPDFVKLLQADQEHSSSTYI
ncbi:EAL domain-containing protein [Vibrio sp. SCSIO 43136]|uniref:EAL domain-containing protein n=1 Tax=Vibrio sp. SCSIO 43136 TaxID=2819101 RepID=UPI0020756675|nr:EAL domain-containing protein [Vibrio sp. SCSIO 43136]USD67728.1 EAL domain-containing protein [Vibrio sp. SCSIO 43136]